MSERAPIFLTEPLVWGFGTAEGQTFTTVDTGVTLDGQVVYRLELATSAASAEILVDDASGEVLIDDTTGNVLYEG